MEIKLIDPVKLEKIKATLDSAFDFYHDLDKTELKNFDYDKCHRTVTYTFTKYYTEIASLMWQESQILAEMETQQAINKKNAMVDSKINKFLPNGEVRKYVLDNVKEQATWIEGHELVSKQEEEIKKVKSTLILLQNYLDQLKFFPKNVECLLSIRKQQQDLFGV